MKMAALLMAAVIVWTGQDDPAALIQKLGSDRFAEREDASKAIESLGARALPALREALEADDAEVRLRAEMLIARIERTALIGPTMIRLDYKDVPIREVVKNLSQRSGMSISLMPDNVPAWSRKVTIEEAEPVPFWEALRRLAATGEVGFVLNPVYGRRNDKQGGFGQIQVSPIESGMVNSDGPSSISGPLRASIVNIHHNRSLSFVTGPVPRAGDLAKAAVRRQQNGAPMGRTNVAFNIELQVAIEPRAAILGLGRPKVLEARDEHGKSLVPQAPPGIDMAPSNVFIQTPRGSSLMPASITLLPPQKPGALISSLKIALPAQVAQMQPEPATFDLENAQGKTATLHDLSVKLESIKKDDNGARYTLELSVKPATEGAGDRPTPPAPSPNMNSMASLQLVVVDAQGQAYPTFVQRSEMQGNMTGRLTLQVMEVPGLGAPKELRYFPMTVADTEAVFEFRGIPTPADQP